MLDGLIANHKNIYIPLKLNKIVCLYGQLFLTDLNLHSS